MMNLIKGIKKVDADNKLTILLLIGLSVFLFVAYLLAAFKSFVNVDAGYYLGVAELIHQGYVPYRDFSLGYTPLFFYALQIPRVFMGAYPVYSVYMLFLYLIVFVDAILMALIVKKVTNSDLLAWFSGLAFLVLYYYLEGVYFILEAFSVCFGLASILLLIWKKGTAWCAFLAGVFSALSFLSKQYGLLFAGVIGVMLLFSDEAWGRKLWNCISAILGFCVVIALFFLLFFICGLTPIALIEALNGSGYGGQSLKMYFDGVAKSVRLFPFLLFLPCLFLWKNKSSMALMIGCVTGLLMASLQFYFNVFPHYFVYLIPFVLVINALFWEKMSDQKVSRVLFMLYYGLFFTAMVIPLYNIYKNSSSLVKHDYRKHQIENAKQIRQIAKTYNCKSALCYWNTFQYYALCPLQPAAMKKYGFSFGYDTEDTYCERLEDADCFVLMKSDLERIREMGVFNQKLTNDFFLVEDDMMGDTKIFVRKKVK